MKKIILVNALLAFFFYYNVPLFAQDTLSSVLPLLQAKTRSAAQNRQVLDLFASSKDPDLIFASGASLVRLVPPPTQTNRLLGLTIRGDNGLRQLFAAVILTAMDAGQEALLPTLQDGTQSADPAVRSYAAAAYTLIDHSNSAYSEDIVQLYIYDPAFAQKAMTQLADTEKQTLKFLRQAAQAKNAQVRSAAAAWLGDMQTQEAAKQLLKMAKTERDSNASAAIATALAKNHTWTLEETAKGLKTSYKKQPSATYALALGFMPGYAVEAIKQGLQDKEANTRINSARAAAYMAGVLASPQAKQYSSDPAFDSHLVKSLIAPLAALAAEKSAAQPYADNALKQISKLK